MKLTARFVETVKKPGGYTDTQQPGLMLRVRESGIKAWVFRYMLNRKARERGLGPTSMVTLEEARDAAAKLRKLVRVGGLEVETQQARRQQGAASAVTFKSAAESYIKAHRAGWKNAKHGAQWTATLEAYAYPVMGELSVQAIELSHVMRVLEPIWQTKPETASRVRGRMESILDWATSSGYRKGDNPARWRGHLENLLPAKGKVKRVEHHPALPYGEVGAFMAQLRTEEGTAARALEFLILTASRTGEVIGARWDEIDMAAKLWTIPPERIKAGRQHRVPLAPAAMTILKELAKLDAGAFVFPGGKPGEPLSSMALLMLLRRMERSDVTAHGFRSSFRDWAIEQTGYPSEVAELALAHSVGTKVEQAYMRSDLFERRRRLAEDWAKFCAAPAPAAKVVPMRRKGG